MEKEGLRAAVFCVSSILHHMAEEENYMIHWSVISELMTCWQLG